MITKTLMIGMVASGLLTMPTMAQNAHQYQGGPKTSVPHTMTEPTTQPTTQKVAKQKGTPTYNAHRYQGGPSSSLPHRSK